MAIAMVVGTSLVVVLARRPAEPAAHMRELPARPDVSWLSREADARVIGPDGEPGPLFAGLQLGGTAPTPEQRERIAAFARANQVAIDLAVANGQLTAIRLDIDYGGCCGYEGVDVLGLRLHRPRKIRCCDDLDAWTWSNKWAYVTGHIHGHVRVHVGHVSLRWEAVLSLADVLERADGLLGQRVDDVRRVARDAYDEYPAIQYRVLEIPYIDADNVHRGRFGAPDDFMLWLDASDGVITGVTFVVDQDFAPLEARWGPGRVHDGVHTWRPSGRQVTARTDNWLSITLQKR